MGSIKRIYSQIKKILSQYFLGFQGMTIVTTIHKSRQSNVLIMI